VKCYVFVPRVMKGRKRATGTTQCQQEAKWKVPMWGDPKPYLVCDEHVKGWRENQPDNVKALNDDTPWENKETGFYRESKVTG
jgi:hypothetical protein